MEKLPDNAPFPLPSATIDVEFGFDLDEASWLARIRGCSATPALGKIGPFELLAEAGRGGQGVVYKARQPRTGRIIAIKRLSAGAFATPNMRVRFEREIEAASALEHPNIVTVFGTEIVDGQAVLAMQWVDGEAIDRWAGGASGRRRPLREVLKLFEKVCSAVMHAHQRGVIHRDLKPSNILIDGNDEPHVLDFGLAKLNAPASPGNLTLTGDFLGTPLFAAPEQLHGGLGDVDVRTDVYALGTVLYLVLTGRTPVDPSLRLADMLHAARTVEAPRPSKFDARLDNEIDAIVLKALAKEKEGRYAFVEALRADVQRYLCGAAVLAHAPSSAYRMRKFIRQHRIAVAVAIGFVAILLGATVTSTTFYLRAEKQTARALREAETQKAISQFVTKTMSRAAPYPLPGNKDITVREAVLAAVVEIDNKELKYPPAVEARLRHEIASTIFELGSIPEALVNQREAVRLSKIAEAAGEPPCLDCYGGLAWVQKELDDYPAAVETLQDAITAMRDTPENPHGKRPEFMNEIAKVRSRQGDFRAALQMIKEAQRLRRQIAPEDDDFFQSCNVVISALVANNAPDFPAETMARETLSFIGGRAAGGTDYAGQLFWIAMLVHERGDLDQAERLIHEAMDIQTKLRGGGFGTHGFRMEFALILRDRNQLEESESILREVVKIRSEYLGDAHRATIDSRVFLATVLHAKGDSLSALPVLEDALSIYRKRFGVDNVHTVRVEGPLAPVLAAVGRTEEAEELFRHALAVRRGVLGERGETATNIHELGKFLLDQGRFDEAEPVLQEALTMRRKVRGEDHPETTATLRALSSIHDQ